MERRRFLTAAGAVCAGLAGFADTPPARAHKNGDDAPAILAEKEVREFLVRMTQEHGFDPRQLRGIFSRVRRNPSVIRLMDAPADPKKKVYWRAYRKRRLRPADIARGARFMRENKASLARAREQYGVPQKITAAILGVETRYGAYTGNFPVLEALATIAFFYPRRAAEFRKELEDFLLYARESRIEPLLLRGSYAGAFGLPQFLPGSARRFAVDFDGDGRADLFTPADAVGSIGNFLAAHGWRREHGVLYPLSSAGDAPALLAAGRANDYRPTLTLAELNAAGAFLAEKAQNGAEKYLLVDLENRYDTEYRAGTANFYALTRYNKSFRYAAAVADLGDALARASGEGE